MSMCVDFVSMGDLASFERPDEYIVKSINYSDDFATPVLTAGQSFILGYTDETEGIYPASPENPVIIFDDFTGAFKWVDFPFKVKSSAMKILKANEDITSLRYLFHVMGWLDFKPTAEHRRQWIRVYANLQVPVPPMEIQREIVRILDKWSEANTGLIALLTRELELRKKQYQYYLDKLLNSGGDMVILAEVAQYSRKRIDAAEVDENNYIGVDNLLQDRAGKTQSLHVPETGIIPAYSKEDILIGNIRPYLKKIYFAETDGGTNGDVLAIHVTTPERVYPKFLYYVLSSEDFFAYDTRYSRGGTMPRGNKAAVMQYQFSLPSLEEQRRIASILDRFNTMCTSLTQGLPAEIQARKKQYAYYRDKLLTFRRKDT